jgi:hypothetical protein
LNTNGSFAGFQLLSGATTSSLIVNVDDFKVQTSDSAGALSETIFSVNTVDGIVEMENVRLKGQLDISNADVDGSMSITNQTITITDAGNNPRVRFGKLS